MKIMQLSVALFMLALPALVVAHQVDRAEQATEVHPESGEVENLYMISAEDLAHELGYVVHGEVPSQELLDDVQEDLQAYLDDHTAVRADGDSCELKEREFVAYPAADGRLHYYQLWQCPTEVHEIELENRIMHDHHHGGYRHIGQIKVGEQIYPTVFEPQFPAYAIYPEFVGDEADAVVEVDLDEREAEDNGAKDEDGDEEESPSEQEEADLRLLKILAGLVLLGVVGLVGFLERR